MNVLCIHKNSVSSNNAYNIFSFLLIFLFMKNNGININISSEEDVFGRGIFSLINAVGFDNEKLFKIKFMILNSVSNILGNVSFVADILDNEKYIGITTIEIIPIDIIEYKI